MLIIKISYFLIITLFLALFYVIFCNYFHIRIWGHEKTCLINLLKRVFILEKLTEFRDLNVLNSFVNFK